MRLVSGLALAALVVLLGCATPAPTDCPICDDPGLVPAAAPEFEGNPEGAAPWPSPVVVPFPVELEGRGLALPEDLGRSEDALYVREEWAYSVRVRNRGSRSAVLVGRLYHHGNALVGRAGQVLETPWGRFRRLPFYGFSQGWLPLEGLGGTGE